jgi:RNA polymerase sigma-70 factor (ECF subfamily)
MNSDHSATERDIGGNDSASPSGDALDDAVTRAQAMTALFRDHNRALVMFLLARLQNEEEAKEVAQEAYVRLLQLHQPVATSFLRYYLFKIAKDLAVDRYRQRTARGRIDRLAFFEGLDVSSPTEGSVMAADELSALQSALLELPLKCQEAFLMHRVDDLSTSEIAERMGLTDRMVRKYLQRALVYCRLRIGGMPQEDIVRMVRT